MLPVPLIFTSGVASGVNCYAAVLLLGLIGKYGHVASIPTLLERPGILIVAGVLYVCQFIAGKIPVLDSAWDVVHTALRPVVGGAIGVVMSHYVHGSHEATLAAAALGGGSALVSHTVKTGVRLGLNVSPEPFTNIIASLGEDAGVAGLMAYGVFHPVRAAEIAGAALAVGILLLVLLASTIRRALRRRRENRFGQRSLRDVRSASR
jgi:Domain of unknown function (DUF4126)